MHLTCATFAYPRLDNAERSAVARVIETLEIPGSFILSTCLRVEIVVPASAAELREALDLAGTGLAKPEITTGQAAAAHLFRVAAGLESPVLGETEILVQYRKAVAEAVSGGIIDGAMIRLLQAGIGAGRKARKVLPLQPHDSMGAIAAGLVRNQERVTIIGAGDMASAVVRNLQRQDPACTITVLARRPEHVSIGGVDVLPIARLDDVLASESHVVSATSASSRLLSQEHLAELLSQRTRPLVIIDMALPPDFSPPPNADVTHYDVDDLALLAGAAQESDTALALVEEAARTAYRRFATANNVGPAIATMIDNADAIVAETMARFTPKLANAADEAVLRQAVHSATRTLLAQPIARVREATDVTSDPSSGFPRSYD